MQQVSQVWGSAWMLAMITVLARRLSLSAFGVYGLFVSVAGYLLIVQGSIEGAAVRALAGASSERDRERVFTTTLKLYGLGGLVAGALIACLGLVLAALLGIPPSLRPSARVGILLLAGLTAIGWPAKASQDLLRGTQRFGVAALGEMVAYGVVAGGVIVLAFARAPLWLLIGLGGSLPVAIGIACFVAAWSFSVPLPYRGGAADPRTARELLGISRYLLVTGVADLIIYSFDRVVLAAFKGTAAVGLYEGAVRPQNLMRQLQGTLVLTVTPVASVLSARDDRWRNQQLLTRGTRYVLAIVAPVAMVLTVLSAPILEAWLGPRFAGASTALSILAAYWLVGGSVSVAMSMLLAAGRVRAIARNAWLYALANLVLVLSLTPVLGLNGIAIGIALPPTLLAPWFLSIALREFDVSVADLARSALLPAYASCAVMGGAMFVLREVLDPRALPAVAALALGGLALVLAAYWLIWFDDAERRLVRGLFRRADP